ncbi:hypothetical protein F5X98DRAFT_330745 [Xylaria grammica]|nr:hypothetical protein F5X98DRAFT_330745 [Xylaria grammica]
MSRDPAQPELSATVKRRYGPYDIQRFDDLLQASVGAAYIGKVHVDCKFLFKKSQWGTLDNRKAGIIYLDLTFIQPSDCRLSSAIIQVTLDDEDKYLIQEFPNGGAMSPLQIRKCGPRQMLGYPRYETVTAHNKYTPEVEIGSIASIGGVGHESVKKTVRDCWWKFEGHLKTNGKTKTGTYKVLQWHVTENDLQTQPLHSNTVHTAFSFDHGGQPFFMHVEVSGKLRSKTSDFRHKIGRGVKNLKFPRSSQRSFTTTLIHFNKPEIFTTPLDEFEKCLDQDMQLCNMTQPIVLAEVQGQRPSESQPPTSPQQPSIGSPMNEFQILEEEDSDLPTIDEFASHSKKVMGPLMASDGSNLEPYGDTQGEKPTEVTSGLDHLQRQISEEKVDLGGVIYVMRIWMVQIIEMLLSYRGSRSG